MLGAAVAKLGGDSIEREQVIADLILPFARAEGRVDDAEERRNADGAFQHADVAERFDNAAQRGGLGAGAREDDDGQVAPDRLRGQAFGERAVGAGERFLRNDDRGGAVAEDGA